MPALQVCPRSGSKGEATDWCFSLTSVPLSFSLSLSLSPLPPPLSKINKQDKRTQNVPWLLWLSGLSAGLWTKRSLVWSPVRAHAWVVGQVPSCVMWEATYQSIYLILMFLSPFLPPFKKKEYAACTASLDLFTITLCQFILTTTYSKIQSCTVTLVCDHWRLKPDCQVNSVLEKVQRISSINGR